MALQDDVNMKKMDSIQKDQTNITTKIEEIESEIDGIEKVGMSVNIYFNISNQINTYITHQIRPTYV